MANLIPVQRVDKNGRLVTRHVKASSAPVSAQKLPAPVMKKLGKQGAFTPTSRQKEKRTFELFLYYTDCDAELTDKLAEDGYHYGKTVQAGFRFIASETEFYDVLSVLSLGNAVTMMRSGVRSKEEALKILNSLHLNRLVEDNAAMTEAMLRNRISFKSFLGIRNECDYSEGTDPQLYADAADILSTRGYSQLVTPWGTGVYYEVLDGRISAADVKTIGVNRFQRSFSSDPIFNALAAIHEGKADYDAAQLAQFLDRTSGEVGYTAAIDMANAYGIEFAGGLDNIWKAQGIHDTLQDNDVETRRAAIIYADTIERLIDPSKPYSLSSVDILKLYREGIDPEIAVEQTEARLTPEQIIAIYKEGIASSIASGFL